jgi:hypothetical protein
MDPEEECYNEELDMQEFCAAEEEIDLECPETFDSEWYSTDEEDEEKEDKEIYAGKRTREGGRSNEKETRASKAQRRETNELPAKKRDTKPVLHPLTEEEKRKRAETRKHNRELQQEQNGGIIRVLLNCLPGLVSHKHISHFRTDLHRHIDKVMFFDREQYKAKRAGKGTPEKGKGNARMENNSLEVEQPKVASPLYSDERIPEAKPATPGLSSASEQVQPPKGSAKENYAIDSIFDSRFMSFEVDDGGDPTYPIRTEVFADIGNLKGHKITLASGATFSGIPKNVCIEAGLGKKIRPTRMMYRTSSSEVYTAEGKVVVDLKIGRLKIKTSMIVMPEDCPYKMLVANDIMGPLKADLLRSSNEVIFYWNNNAIRVPMVHDSDTSEVRPRDLYLFVTQLDDPEQPWVKEPPQFEVIPLSKNEKKKEKRRRQKEREKG